MRSISLKLQQLSTRATSRPEPKPARSDLSTSLTLAAMSLGYGVVQLDVTIVNTALNSWRSIFLVNLPIGLAGLWLSWRYANETTRYQQREIDLPGQIAAIAALGCLAGAIIEGGTLGWGNPFVIAGFAASAVLATCSFCGNCARRNPCCRCRCSSIGCSR